METASSRVALVTGASTGFGRLTAEALARAGYRTYAAVRDPGGRNAAPARELIAAGLHVVDLDVTSDASVDAAAARILGDAGHLDVLVNNAGAAYFGLVETFTPELAQRQFDVNVFGVLRVNRAFLPSMRARRSGLVIFVSSVVGRFVLPFNGIYTASKHALEALAETSAYELQPFGVDVSIVEPSAYGTNIFNNQIWPDDETRAAEYGDLAKKPAQIAEQLSKSTRDPQEVADAVVDIAGRAPGTRPLRRTVGEPRAADAVNAALAPIQRKALESVGATAMIPAVPFETGAPATLKAG